jgi:hypothetical protein
MNESVGAHKESKKCVRNLERKILRENVRLTATDFLKILCKYVH